jgi:uncharacterized protein YcaQ
VSSASVLRVTPLAARQFLRRALLLDEPAPDIATALAYHGYIQIDPINVCGRMHDLILRNRVRGYREGDLMRHLHGPEAAPHPASARAAFEHHLPDSNVLVAFPLEAWPHLHAAMLARTRHASAWSGKLTPREREFAPHLFAELAARGPLGSDDLHDGRRAPRLWGSMTLAKSTLQKLFFHGRVLIARRDGQRRLYDLPERVLPASVHAAPTPAAEDTARWLILLKLRQRRLVTLKRDELRLVADVVQPIAVEGCPPLYCLQADANLFDPPASPSARTSSSATDARAPRLIAPLDPLIYDRRVTAALWNFAYTWEVYTPPHKRVRGYYALPVLAATELIGHVEPKADRATKKLTVLSRRVRRGHRIAPAVRELAQWLGLKA